jgi:hypothetical protein
MRNSYEPMNSRHDTIDILKFVVGRNFIQITQGPQSARWPCHRIHPWTRKKADSLTALPPQEHPNPPLAAISYGRTDILLVSLLSLQHGEW